MKLTKGKLSKLFHKKKQTMRRYKNQRKYRRASKTFRQRKPLNLHRSSMKKIERMGGAEPDEKVPLVVKPASDEATITTTEPITEPVSEPTTEPIPEPVPEPATETISEPEAALEPVPEPISEPIPASMPEPEPVAAPAPEPEPAPTLTPASEPEPEPAPTTESAPAPTTESAPEPTTETAPEPTTETAPEPEPQPETTKVDAIPTADAVPKQMDAENVKPESSLAPPSVSDALDIIANKIAKAVVKEMRETSATGSTANQDADVAVPLAVNALVKQTQLAPE